MTIKVSIQELYDKGLLDEFCKLRGIPYDSSLAGSDVYILTEEEANQIGLLPKQ